MKKLFTLFVLALVAAVSIHASAQSLVGKWSAEAGGTQQELIESIGGEIEKADNIWTFSNKNTYTIYSYVKASAEIMGFTMFLEMEMIDNGNWNLNSNQLTVTSQNADISKFNISFSEPSLNSEGEAIKSTLSELFQSASGESITYNIVFIDDNTIELEFDNELMPLSFTLTRTR